MGFKREYVESENPRPSKMCRTFPGKERDDKKICKVEEDNPTLEEANEWYKYMNDLKENGATEDDACIKQILNSTKSHEAVILEHGHTCKLIEDIFKLKKDAQLTFLKNLFENNNEEAVTRVFFQKSASYTIERWLKTFATPIPEGYTEVIGSFLNYLTSSIQKVLFNPPASNLLRTILNLIAVTEKLRKEKGKKNKISPEGKKKYLKLEESHKKIVDSFLFGEFAFGLKNFSEQSYLLQDTLNSCQYTQYETIKKYFNDVWSNNSENAILTSLKDQSASPVWECIFTLLKDSDVEVVKTFLTMNAIELSSHSVGNFAIGKFLKSHSNICDDLINTILPNMNLFIKSNYHNILDGILERMDKNQNCKDSFIQWFKQNYGKPSKALSYAKFLTDNGKCEGSPNGEISFDVKCLNPVKTKLMKSLFKIEPKGTSSFFENLSEKCFLDIIENRQGTALLETFVQQFAEGDIGADWLLGKLGSNLEKLLLGKSSVFVFLALWKTKLSLEKREELLKIVVNCKKESKVQQRFSRLLNDMDHQLFLENKKSWTKKYTPK
uniref:PUM-HD domain-containing protein n=1 Tax=Parastrongyloides trichosuri TaxID=131310 RepID=A0A0N4ZP59_PARTI